jgi:hypothetical protein
MDRTERRAPRPLHAIPSTLPRIPTLLALSGLLVLGLPAAPGLAASPAEVDTALDPRVAGIEIDMTIDPERGMIVQEVTLDIRASNAANLEFGINEWMTVERSRADAGIIEHRKGANTLRVFVNPPITDSRRLTFRVTGQPRRGAEYLVREDRVLLEAADRWYPTLGATWAQARVQVRLPAGWTAVAPGAPVKRSDGSAAVWTWSTRQPVRSVALVAAPGLGMTERKAIRTPVRIVAPQPGARAAAVVDSVEHPLAWFQSSLVPYPFEGLNLVLLPGLERRIRASGMLAVPLDAPLDGPADGADLLAGQWFGERIAGDGPWIEAFAAWYATLYARDRALALPAEIRRLREEYFAMSPNKDVALSRADSLTPAAVLRGKGSAAPDMVRISVGDRRVFDAVADLFRGPISPPFSLAEIRSVFEEHAGATLLRSFADWFDRTGAPELQANMKATSTPQGEWRVDLSLVQLRGNYALPVEVVFFGRGPQHREVVHVDGETTSFTTLLPFEPLRVEIDPLGKLFLWASEPASESG